MHYDHSEESLKNVIKSKTHTFRVEIRRKNIGETLNTKRCKHIEETSTEANGPELFLEEPKILNEKFQAAVKQFFEGLEQNNSEFLLNAVTNIRKMITYNIEKLENTEWIISELKKNNLLFHLINFVDAKYYESEVIKEAMWSLINISSTRNEEILKFILDCGLYKKCVQIILMSSKSEIINDAAWILGNLLENSAALRDDILYNKIIEILLIKAKDCSSPLKEHIYKDAVFLIQISTRIEPYFHIEIRKLFSKEILKLLENSTDPNMIYICVNAFCEICLTFDEDENNCVQFIQEIINLNGISTLFDIFNLNELMENLSPSQINRIIIPITKIFGILSLGDDNQIKVLLDKGILQLLIKLLNNKNKVIRRNSCWILSNLLASNQNLVAEITLNHSLIQKIITLFMVDELEVRTNILFCFKNAFANGTQFTYEKMINFGIIDALLSNMATNQDSDYLFKVLECLELILVYGEELKEENEMNPISIRIEKKSGLEILENLQYHHSLTVTEKLEQMVKNYFCHEKNF